MPMSIHATPAMEALLNAMPAECVWGQVVVRRPEHGFALRHADDRQKTEAQLRPVRVTDLRTLAQTNRHGEFRPLRAAPDLVSGWCAQAHSPGELEFALNALYPGSVADWFAARAERPRVTDFRGFTSRQSGMYRITAMLSDAQAAQVIRATCAAANCLKRRLWSVEGLVSDETQAKCLIPCLEPCAVLLEFGRKAMRIEQQEPLSFVMRPDDAASAVSALERALTATDGAGRTADVSAPSNPLRLRLTLEKLRDAMALARRPDTSEE